MIRRSQITDKDEIYALICALENTVLDRQGFDDTFDAQSSDDRYICFVYEEDKTIEGAINMRIEKQLHHVGKVCEIMELVVSETKRNRGIGKQLLQKAIETARNEGCKRIELSSSNWRTGSHRFYMENGFDATHIDLTMDL